MDTHELANGQQTVRFKGTVLGTSSSEEYNRSQGKQRWHEVHIFSVDSPEADYIVYKVGRTEMPGETDRGTVHVCGSARGVIESLESVDGDGVTFMTRVARTALQEAMRNDPVLRDGFSVRDLSMH